jgi:hypothetical protein
LANFSAHNPSTARQNRKSQNRRNLEDYRQVGEKKREENTTPKTSKPGPLFFSFLSSPLPSPHSSIFLHQKEKLSPSTPFLRCRDIFFFSPSMAAATERFLHLARPLAHTNVGLQTNIAPLTVQIQPQVYMIPPR